MPVYVYGQVILGCINGDYFPLCQSFDFCIFHQDYWKTINPHCPLIKQVMFYAIGLKYRFLKLTKHYINPYTSTPFHHIQEGSHTQTLKENLVLVTM